jgi:hypothetical protein
MTFGAEDIEAAAAAIYRFIYGREPDPSRAELLKGCRRFADAACRAIEARYGISMVSPTEAPAAAPPTPQPPTPQPPTPSTPKQDYMQPHWPRI